jgi:hypothetical protein
MNGLLRIRIFYPYLSAIYCVQGRRGVGFTRERSGSGISIFVGRDVLVEARWILRLKLPRAVQSHGKYSRKNCHHRSGRG